MRSVSSQGKERRKERQRRHDASSIIAESRMQHGRKNPWKLGLQRSLREIKIWGKSITLDQSIYARSLWLPRTYGENVK